MARPKNTYGIFRVKPGTRPIEFDGDVIEAFSSNDEATTRLNTLRDAEMAAGGNRYALILLPLGPKGEGLLGPGA